MKNRLGTHKYVLSVRPNELQRSLIYENISLGKGIEYRVHIATIGSRVGRRVGGSCNCDCNCPGSPDCGESCGGD